MLIGKMYKWNTSDVLSDLKGLSKGPNPLKNTAATSAKYKTSWFRKINGTFSIKRISNVFENKYFEFVKCTIYELYDFRNKKS